MSVLNSVLYVVVALLITGIVGANWLRPRYQRPKAVTRFASQYGLQYLGTTGIDLAGYDFPLLELGDDRGFKNVLAGRWQDLPVREADFWYRVSSALPDGGGGPEYLSFLIADLAAYLPNVLIDKKGLLTKAAEHLGADHIDFGSAEFNRKFQVKAPDTDFAVKLIDAAMMQWLLSADDRFRFEVAGSRLLVSCNFLRPGELILIFDAAKGFTDHIPGEIWAQYGPSHPAGPPG